MTIGDYCNVTQKDFAKCGRRAKLYGLLGRIFRSKKFMDKAVYYLDKRWDMMIAVLDQE